MSECDGATMDVSVGVLIDICTFNNFPLKKNIYMLYLFSIIYKRKCF